MSRFFLCNISDVTDGAIVATLRRANGRRSNAGLLRIQLAEAVITWLRAIRRRWYTRNLLPRLYLGYTTNMKTAISVPDDLFRLAEVAARRLRVSRSQLYATAISEFLTRQQASAVTERLNEVYSRLPAKVNSALHRAQLRSLEKDSW
jgi:hypothetical protein